MVSHAARPQCTVLPDSWIKTASKSHHNLAQSIVNLKSFNARRRLKRAFHAVRAAEKLKRASIDFARIALEDIKEEVQHMGKDVEMDQLEQEELENAKDGVAVATRVGAYGSDVAAEAALPSRAGGSDEEETKHNAGAGAGAGAGVASPSTDEGRPPAPNAVAPARSGAGASASAGVGAG